MSVYKTEEEQVEDLKRWLKGYGPSVIIGIVLALIISYGWRYWNSYKTHQAEQASTYYTAMITADEAKQTATVSKNANQLITEFPSSPYAQFASMLLAKQSVVKKQYAEAITQLQWVDTHSKDENLKTIAQIRIARIQIQMNQATKALATLSKLQNTAFQGLVAMTQGDAYLALKQTDKAKQAYTNALAQVPNAEINAPLLKMKLENINSL